MKKFLLFLLIVCLASTAFCFVGCSEYTVDYDAELILNGNLENKMSEWTLYSATSPKITPTMVDIKNGDSTTYFEESATHGGAYVSISQSAEGVSYAYYSQTVALEKDAKYLLKADVKVTSQIEADAFYGAFVGLAEDSAIYRSTVDEGEWTTLEVAFYNYSYDEVNVRFGLGTDVSLFSAGTALFDNISLKKINDEEAAVGMVALDLGSKGASGFDKNYLTTPSGIVFTVLLTVLGAAMCYAFYVWFRRYASRSIPTVEPVEVDEKKKAVKTIVLSMSAVLAAFAVRLILVLTLYGHGAEMNTLGITAESLANNGLIKYYFEYTPYYTPGVTYLLWIFGLLAKALNILSGTKGFAVFIKIPAVVSDLLAVYFLFLIAHKRTSDPVKSFIIALAYALVPTAFIASAVYGSFFSIAALFLLLAFNAAREKKLIQLTVFYGLAVFFVAEALLLLPLLITYAIVLYVKYPETRNVLPIAATVAIIGGYLLTLPLTWNFFITGKPFIVLERYFTIFSELDLFTDGAFNVYSMITLQSTEPNTAGVVMSALLAACAMLSGILLYIKCRDRQKLVLIAAYTMLFIYTFCIRMTIFVVLPALALAFLYSVYTYERRILALTVSSSILVTISACYELMICKYIPGGLNAQEIAISANDPVAIVFSTLFVLITLITGYVVFDICVKGRERAICMIDQNYLKYLASFFKKKESVKEEND